MTFLFELIKLYLYEANIQVPTFKLCTYLQVSLIKNKVRICSKISPIFQRKLISAYHNGKDLFMKKCNIKDANFNDTGYSYTLSLINGKYKPIILYCLMEYEPVRFNEMRRYLNNVADKTLSQNLKELEADDLIIRTMYPQIPPKVEYTLTERGHSLVSVLDKLCEWGIANRK